MKVSIVAYKQMFFNGEIPIPDQLNKSYVCCLIELNTIFQLI